MQPSRPPAPLAQPVPHSACTAPCLLRYLVPNCACTAPPPPTVPQDQYVSVEELLLALADDPRFGGALFREIALAPAKLEETIQEIRGGKT